MAEATVTVPLWAWAAVGAVIAVMLAVDVLLHRDNHVIELREAAAVERRLDRRGSAVRVGRLVGPRR